MTLGHGRRRNEDIAVAESIVQEAFLSIEHTKKKKKMRAPSASFRRMAFKLLFPRNEVSFEYNERHHRCNALYDVGCHQSIDVLFQMPFGILFAHVSYRQLFGRHLFLLFQRFDVILRQLEHLLDHAGVLFVVHVVVLNGQPVHPRLLVQIQQHLLFEFVLAIVDTDRIVMPIEAVNQRLNRWFSQMAQVRRCLPSFLPENEWIRIDQTECIDDDFALDTLNGIDDHGLRTTPVIEKTTER